MRKFLKSFFACLVCCFLLTALMGVSFSSEKSDYSVSQSTTTSSSDYSVSQSTTTSKSDSDKDKKEKRPIVSPRYTVPNIDKKGQYGRGK